LRRFPRRIVAPLFCISMRSKRLRVLLLGPNSNPNSVTGALIGYCHGEALARLHDVTFVIKGRDEEAVRKANGPFREIVSIPPCWIDRFYAWVFQHIFKKNYGSLLWSAFCIPLASVFEWRAWKRLRRRIFNDDFDVVLRIVPIDPKEPSPFAFFLRKGPIPFVLGPLNGGLPWPKGFSQLEKQLPAASYWATTLRKAYRFFPFSRSTYTHAAAIIAGSSQTCKEFASYRDKLFYMPGDNGVKSSWIEERSPSVPDGRKPLQVIMVNRLVSLKAVDLALRGMASVLRKGNARLSIVGDGPERGRLENLVDELKIRPGVEFCGWLNHSEALTRMKGSDVLLFPSLREFGGGVVFEALALGAVPVVADFGGPGDIVTDEVGYRIPLTNEQQMAAEIESVMERLASDRSHLETLRRQGAVYAHEQLTWDAKARMVTGVLLWVVGVGPKPVMRSPKLLEKVEEELPCTSVSVSVPTKDPGYCDAHCKI
jgi:glycosyltransferase involved in cell wall biosynthesis